MILCAYFNKVVIRLAKILLDDAEHRAVMSLYFSFLFVVCVTLVTAKNAKLCWMRACALRAREEMSIDFVKKECALWIFKCERVRFWNSLTHI